MNLSKLIKIIIISYNNHYTNMILSTLQPYNYSLCAHFKDNQ